MRFAIVVVALCGAASCRCADSKAPAGVDASVNQRRVPRAPGQAAKRPSPINALDLAAAATLLPTGEHLQRLGDSGVTRDQRNLRAAYCAHAPTLDDAKAVVTAALEASGWQDVSLNLVADALGGTAQRDGYRMMVMSRGQERGDCDRRSGRWFTMLTIQKLGER